MKPIIPVVVPHISLRSNAEVSSGKAVATRFEKAFLSEMLRQADTGFKSGNTNVDDIFGSFGRDAISESIVKQGGIGIAKIVERYLKQTSGETR